MGRGFPVKRLFGPMELQTGKEGLQLHPTPLQHQAYSGCLCLPLFGPAATVHVMVSRPSGSGSGCSAPTLGPSNLPVPSSPSPTEGDSEDQGPENQGDIGVPPVAPISVLGADVGDVGGTSNAAPTL